VRLILDAAATRSDGRWKGNLRNRFLLEVLAETGLRLGEAMGSGTATLSSAAAARPISR